MCLHMFGQPKYRQLLVLFIEMMISLFFLEYYKAYAGIHCNGEEHHIEKLEADTIQSCNEACDSNPECAAYAIRDNWSTGGCFLKKESCLENMTPRDAVTMFVKPSMHFHLKLFFKKNLLDLFVGLLVTSPLGFKARVSSLILWKRRTWYICSLRFTSDVTPADLLTATMAAKQVSSMYLWPGIGGAQMRDLSHHRRMLYRLSYANSAYWFWKFYLERLVHSCSFHQTDVSWDIGSNKLLFCLQVVLRWLNKWIY